MNETHTMRALLDFEDAAHDVLFEKVPGTDAYLWLLARWPLARALSEQNLNVAPIPARKPSRVRGLLQHALGQVPTRASSDRLREQVDHLFVTSGTTRDVTETGVGNWLTDAFATSLGSDAAVVQDSAIRAFAPRTERPLNPRTWTFAPALLRVTQSAKLSPLTSAQQMTVEHHLTAMLNYFDGLLSDNLKRRVVTQTIRRADRVRHTVKEFGALLDRTNPRKIYMQTAAYGDRSPLIRLAHHRGIKVIELQHGWVGASHSAYNFGRAMHNSEMTSSLPDTFYTFGDYWGKDLRFPGSIVPVGKPVLEESARSAASYPDRPHRLLLVSSVYERDRLLRAARMLRQLLPESWQIVLRPHPSERSTATELFAEALTNGVVLDLETEVSASIASSRAVVGMISTVLYEALPMGVHVSVIDTNLSEHYSDTTVFPSRLNDEASFEAFVGGLTRNEIPLAGHTDSVWKPNSVSAFHALAIQA